MKIIIFGIQLVTILSISLAFADDQAQKAEVAKEKAEVLEEKVATEGSQASPPPTSQLITKTQVQAVDPSGKEPMEDAITCLARTIYWEARGTSISGMEVVANVVMNRVGHEGFPETVCGVVKQGQEKGACQFSWWCDGRPDDAKEDESYATAKEITRKALNHQLVDQTNGALYFHHKKVSPSWSKEYIKTTEVEDFLFYKPSGDKAK
ncbi:cell wall hydrolase [Nitrosomonas sp. PY1]|uniref:cell wall hydrolase n=1 Tax=Nitrosomonas sp. PY1 TaxID=1803906 RepID=UPI001FC8A6C7|nr:cell wall hydrolase [Nitrosomonas sp. PY1]GKS68317.1 cell wall hydrolase [Nitrosomonas sp. PY1]